MYINDTSNITVRVAPAGERIHYPEYEASLVGRDGPQLYDLAKDALMDFFLIEPIYTHAPVTEVRITVPQGYLILTRGAK